MTVVSTGSQQSKDSMLNEGSGDCRVDYPCLMNICNFPLETVYANQNFWSKIKRTGFILPQAGHAFSSSGYNLSLFLCTPPIYHMTFFLSINQEATAKQSRNTLLWVKKKIKYHFSTSLVIYLSSLQVSILVPKLLNGLALSAGNEVRPVMKWKD